MSWLRRAGFIFEFRTLRRVGLIFEFKLLGRAEFIVECETLRRAGFVFESKTELGFEHHVGMQDLSDEQKVALIRRELPGCSPEEAMNALEVCTGDVDAAIAVMSQVPFNLFPFVCAALCCNIAGPNS